jgi:hypothetical protein
MTRDDNTTTNNNNNNNNNNNEMGHGGNKFKRNYIGAAVVLVVSV